MNIARYRKILLLPVIIGLCLPSLVTPLLAVAADTDVPPVVKTSDTDAPPATQTNTTPQKTFTLTNPLRKDINSVGSLVRNFVGIVSIIAVIVGVLAIIYAGFQMILARGDVTKLKELKDRLIWIVIGIAVVLGARIIVDLIINTLSATGAVDVNTVNGLKGSL